MKQKILIADDDEVIKLILRRVFEDLIVLTANDGQTAMSMIMTERPSVALLDINMPVMDGLEVLCTLKDKETAPLFIMMTGNDELEMVNTALELGAASYITKPFETDLIRKVVLSALAEREGEKKPGNKPWQVKKAGEQNQPP